MSEKNIMNRQPLFSVVMPVYNVEKYLKKSISSILSQTFSNFELIIVDDGSTDNSGAICDSYADKDERIRVIHQSNKGLLGARRIGLKHTLGKYIVHIDSDDECSTELLNELSIMIQKFNPDLLLYDYSDISDEGVISVKPQLFPNHSNMISKKELLNVFVNDVRANMMWIKCSKRDIIDIENDYSEYGRLNMCEDELQSAALILKANKIVYIPKALYYYRINNTSITHKCSKSYVFDSMMAKQKVLEMLQQLNVDSELLNQFFNNYLHRLNVYNLKIVNNLQKDEYYEYRKKLHSIEIDLWKFNGTKYNWKERLLYSIMNSNRYLMIKTIGIIYRRCIEG